MPAVFKTIFCKVRTECYHKWTDIPTGLNIERIQGECLLISSLPGKASRTLVDIARLAEIKRIQGECLLISSLPGEALRTLVDIVRLAEIRGY